MRNILIIIVCFAIVICSCENSGKSDPKTNQSGEELSKTYCVSCHVYPEPDRLDKTTWHNFVLSRMGAFLGIFDDNATIHKQIPSNWIEPGIGGERVRKANIYPKEPLLSEDDWKKIKQFYIDRAPAKLPQNPLKKEINIGLPNFKTKPFLVGQNIDPLIQEIEVNEDLKRIYVSGYDRNIYELDFNGKLQSTVSVPGHFVDIKSSKEGFGMLNMASRMGTDNPLGTFRFTERFEDLRSPKKGDVLKELMRPVHFQANDLNYDGKLDYLICEYGNNLGSLSLYLRNDRGYKKDVLFPDDGAIKTELADLNGDGFLDIMALQANADEGIDVYLNDGLGVFSRSRILRFPSSNGSTHFELNDFDGDGDVDIIYSNGDNGDYKPILKPYHGIHVYLNENMEFKESLFLPLNGVYQASATDYDQDGDQDIAAVSYHPDFQGDAKESFVLFTNDGNGGFSSKTIKEYDHSRWMRFINVDIDSDGDIDILLTAMNIKTPEVPAKTAQKWQDKNLPVLLLENTIK